MNVAHTVGVGKGLKGLPISIIYEAVLFIG